MCPFFTTGDTRTMTLASLTSRGQLDRDREHCVDDCRAQRGSAFHSAAHRFQRPSEEMPTRKAARSYDHLGSKGEKPGVGGPDLKRSGHRSHSFGELGISREVIRDNQSCQLVLTRDNRSSWVYSDRISPQSAGRSVVRGRVAVVTNGADRNG